MKKLSYEESMKLEEERVVKLVLAMIADGRWDELHRVVEEEGRFSEELFIFYGIKPVGEDF